MESVARSVALSFPGPLRLAAHLSNDRAANS
jgi:hypothetical protein